MKKTLLKTRKFNGEEYKFFLNEPEFTGEKGICGIEIIPYIEIETPKNCFGYNDTVLFNNGIPYTLNRYLQPWILKQLKIQADKLKKIIEKNSNYICFLD